MNRVYEKGCRMTCHMAWHAIVTAAAVIFLCSGASATQAAGKSPEPQNEQSAVPQAQQGQTPQAGTPQSNGADATAQKKDDDDDDGGGDNPFVPAPAKPLPPGMTGSNVNDPRSNLTPGLYDAGETAMGIKHVVLLKKPDAFQLGAEDPTDPRIGEMLRKLDMSPTVQKLPPPIQMLIAELAFGNSDLAFQGNHLFQGNFYGVSIYDIADPAKTTLVTSMVCPGGQGDVSVYKNLLFMSVEMPNGRVDCGTQGFPAPPAPPGEANTQAGAGGDKDAQGKDGQDKDGKKKF